MYKEDEYLALSGIQHFFFCRRQWALIHIEQQWEDSYLTADGTRMHKNVHNPAFRESRGNGLIIRGLRVFSASLGISGQCDAVEFHRNDETGVSLHGKPGKWSPFPVEYKRGKPAQETGDLLQLCAQAMCLEEMLCCEIPRAALYYGEPRRRYPVELTETLRQQVRDGFAEMHQLYSRGHTPSGKLSKACRSCSLSALCLPTLEKRKSVQDYLDTGMRDTI